MYEKGLTLDWEQFRNIWGYFITTQKLLPTVSIRQDLKNEKYFGK